jgi:hypothetical protein
MNGQTEQRVGPELDFTTFPVTQSAMIFSCSESLPYLRREWGGFPARMRRKALLIK